MSTKTIRTLERVKRQCASPTCHALPISHGVMCRAHWDMLPLDLRVRLWELFQQGGDRHVLLVAATNEARDEIVNILSDLPCACEPGSSAKCEPCCAFAIKQEWGREDDVLPNTEPASPL